MNADWDLHAVVRGCCSTVSSSTTTTTTATGSSQSSEFCSQQKSTFSSFFPDLFQPTSDNSLEQFMNDLYNYNQLRYRNLEKPPSPPQSFTISPFNHHQQQQQQPEKQFQVKKKSLGISRCTTTHAHGTTTKIKKRKNLIKRVCQVPAEGSSPDLWSWRKYGQKPIKGSPYPRGYYRCSTLKGCSARKQVERNRSDPGMLIITYTGEHTHPLPTHVNSLAGITRNKTTVAGDKTTVAGDKPTPSSPENNMNKTQHTDYTDDENNFDISGVITDEDTFDGLDDLVASPVTGHVFPITFVVK